MNERVTIDQLLATARARLRRLSPEAAHAAMASGAVLIDIRAQEQRRADGVVPGSLWFPRNVLEWRVDPSSDAADPAVADPRLVLVLLCAQGFQSSLAAATLQDLGFEHATDVIGGFEGWRRARLPVEPFREPAHARAGSADRVPAGGIGSTGAMSTAENLKPYVLYSARARSEYRACQQEEAELFRRHGVAIAPPMPFELVAAWLEAGAPADAEEPPVALLFRAFTAALGWALAWQDEARGGGLTPEAIITGEAPRAMPQVVWVERVLRAGREQEERLDDLGLRVRCRIVVALAYDVITEAGPFPDLDALRAAVVARATG